MQTITIKIIDIDFVKDNEDMILSVLDEERIKKADRLIKETDRFLSLGAGLLTSVCAPKGKILFNENGKPYAEGGPFFNVSHSGRYVVAATDVSRETGVDIQKIDEKRLAAIRYVSEASSVEQAFAIWANKESLIKCLGANMSIIKEVPALPLNGARHYKGEGFYTRSTIFDGYALSVTLKGVEPFVTVVEKAELKEDIFLEQLKRR